MYRRESVAEVDSDVIDFDDFNVDVDDDPNEIEDVMFDVIDFEDDDDESQVLFERKMSTAV